MSRLFCSLKLAFFYFNYYTSAYVNCASFIAKALADNMCGSFDRIDISTSYKREYPPKEIGILFYACGLL